ncbi:MAG: alpha/beta fold hydrolase, partial [Spirochaetales bacterium]|nr:alpha/beta fold hydrolase [Spirochaetales bacterium]
LLGSGANWHSIARGLSARFRVLAVDARNHGFSPWCDGMDYPSQAADVLDLLDNLSLEKAFFVGHSMGGKTAMEVSLSAPERVLGLVVADIAPIAYTPRYREMIETLLEVDVSSIDKRSEADALLAEQVEDRMLRLFLLKNLERREGGGFRWRINLPGIVADYQSVWDGIPGGRSYNGPVLFVAGGNGGYLRQGDHEPIRKLFPAAEFVTFENAGHWVHAEEPEAFMEKVASFFSNRSG